MLNFSGTNGATPYGSLILSGNTLYGTTGYGGTHSFGNVFGLDTSAVAASINNIVSADGTISVYPNPNNGQFNIALYSNTGQDMSEIQVEIYTLLGEQVFTQTISSANNISHINIGNRAAGFYIYKVLNINGELLGEGKLVID